MYYKDCDIVSLGGSDIAALVAVAPGKQPEWLYFGEDGSYRAYILHEDDKLSTHYSEVLRVKHWLRIYDDDGLVFRKHADEIIVYRAGDFGCAIQLIGER